MLRVAFAIAGLAGVAFGVLNWNYFAIVGGALLLLAAYELHRALHISMLIVRRGEKK